MIPTATLVALAEPQLAVTTTLAALGADSVVTIPMEALTSPVEPPLLATEAVAGPEVA